MTGSKGCRKWGLFQVCAAWAQPRVRGLLVHTTQPDYPPSDNLLQCFIHIRCVSSSPAGPGTLTADGVVEAEVGVGSGIGLCWGGHKESACVTTDHLMAPLDLLMGGGSGMEKLQTWIMIYTYVF